MSHIEANKEDANKHAQSSNKPEWRKESHWIDKRKAILNGSHGPSIF